MVLAAAREGYPSLLVEAGLPQHRLAALAPAEAGALLDATAHALSLVVRDRVLGEAAGNPPALMELPVTAIRTEPARPGLLPLTQRLEQAFAARVSDLPERPGCSCWSPRTAMTSVSVTSSTRPAR